MRFLPILFVAAAALGSVSTAAEARDGCGRGLFYNGYRCVPQQREYYGGGPDRRFFQERREYRGGYDGRQRGARCANPSYTVQDGVCKPYSGR